jgi:hypothetical protein
LQDQSADPGYAGAAVRLLEGLIPEFGDLVPVVRPGVWVYCGAGWGQIHNIRDAQTEQPIAHYIQGSQQPILRINLRAGERDRAGERSRLGGPCNEWVEVDLATGTIRFEKEGRIWTCGKCRQFSTAINPDRISTDHDPATHEGHGSKIIQEQSGQRRIMGPIRYQNQRPRKIWQ